MIKFGTGGWRAIIGDEFTKENICILAKAMADKMICEQADGKGVVIGYDRRFLSREAVIWSCEVLAAAGIKCYFVNRSVPTPLIMDYVMKHQFPYGFMVTASHNPAIYNGIKVFTGGGRDADEVQTRDIERYIARVDAAGIPRKRYEEAKKQGLVEEIYPMNEYIDGIMSKIDMDAIKKSQLKVAFDPMYGVSKTALSTILISGRCDLDVIHQEHDTLFGGRLPAPTADTLRALQNQVMEWNYDLGIATDGDADRLGVIDDKGHFLHPNDILVLLYYYLIRYKGLRGPVVRNLATTHRLDQVAAAFGEKCYEVPVGFKYISAKMTETGAVIGGESSGGLTVAGHINGKDGVYAATLLVEMIAVTGKPLSELVLEIRKKCGEMYMEERAYEFTEQEKERLLEVLYEKRKLPDLADYQVERVSYMDGCKVYFKNNGWVIARFSGTEPLLRIFCEMPDKQAAREICGLFETYLGL
ncbi:phosphoglucomutase/phosphomannomutase family protein [Enterocloster asparagiformis]|uniref:phosphoglucomutase/phosphomannomutase family protein n=1 Tax=Enterocloster asparagiformis TaxID=333367 RepID=UPI0034C0AAD1